MTSRRIVALGGGHGLAVSLAALRQLTTDLTAVVTVADDGGSSGRIRKQLGVLPPGDLRMALAALAGESDRDQAWARLYQHRFAGTGSLGGHPVGNLVLTGLLEQCDDPVRALAMAADAVGAVGRVLPMSLIPLDLVATVQRGRTSDRIHGQSVIAVTDGQVCDVELVPPDAPACAAAVAAVRRADVVVLGPGSWFTSVIPHLLLKELAAALVQTDARVMVTLNLVPQPGETDGFSPGDHLRVLHEYCPDLSIAAVIVDQMVADEDLLTSVGKIGATLVTARVRSAAADDRHDPIALAGALDQAISAGAVGR
jgi:uncharacterized cofD-like protein